MRKCLIALLMVIALVGCSTATSPTDGSPVQSSRDTTGSTPAPTATPVPAPTAMPAPEPMKALFEGRGDSISGPFQLEEGVVILVAKHSGSGNFIVKVFGSQSEDELSINEIGGYLGARAHGVEPDSLLGLRPGEHRLEVTADGPWSIDVTQEFPSSAARIPISTSGRGDDVVRWVALESGNHILTANHTGQGNFIVWVLPSQGGAAELVINEIGNYSGQNRLSVEANSLFGLQPGLHLVAIQADGNWDLSITR